MPFQMHFISLSTANWRRTEREHPEAQSNKRTTQQQSRRPETTNLAGMSDIALIPDKMKAQQEEDRACRNQDKNQA
jgi:hypothetical protein